jgi:hypothetical protein
MNGDFYLRDLQLFKNDADKLSKISSDIGNTDYGIANPDTANARVQAGDKAGEYEEEDIKAILRIKKKTEIRKARELAANIKNKYGVTIILPEDE